MKYYDIIFKKNNKFKYSSSKTKVKVSKTKFVLLNIKSNLYGNSYIYLLPNEYNKLIKIKNVKLSYKFLDGELVDNDKFYESDVWIKNTYYYNFGRELYEKLEEIKMIEYVLNDAFWIFDSYYSFIFCDYKIEFEFNNKKYKLLSKLDNNSFVEVNKKFFLDIKSLSGDCRLFITEIDGEDSLNVIDRYLQNSIDYNYSKPNIIELYIQAISPLVIDELDSSHTEYISYYIKNRLLKINNRSIKNIDLKNFIN